MVDYRFSKLANPLLFYIDKSGSSVFRNYFLFKNDGWMYGRTIEVKDAGSVLEFRIEIDKKLKLFNIISFIFLYICMIHLQLSFITLLSFLILWIFLVYGARMLASGFYSIKLKETYGEYKTVNFNPKISQDKSDFYEKNFVSKIAVYLIIAAIFFLPSVILLKTISFLGNKKNPNIKVIEGLTSVYTTIYPKTPLIYDINAVSKYKSGDFTASVNDYIKIFKLTGKKFCEKDYRRFANLLYLERKANGIQSALDLFNEYTTAKSLNYEQKLKLLWIKSIFSISGNLTDYVVQDYDDLLDSVAGNKKKEFYILADKAYMLYLMKDFKSAIDIYNNLIPYAKENKKIYGNELTSLYLERGFAKMEFGDKKGADDDFVESKVDINKIGNYEPVLRRIDFIIGDF